jgi:DNA replication ATP-dependent helicase Dna2
MSVELWTGGEFEHSHEMEALASFLKSMLHQYDSEPTRFCVLGNFMVNYCPIDLAVVKNNGITVIELKHVSGPVFGGENGDWIIRDGSQTKVLRGGSRGNPYNQVIAYRIAFLKFLESHRKDFLQPRSGLEPRLDHVQGIVALDPTIPKGSHIDLPDMRWLKVTGLDNLHREIFLARSSQLSMQSREITRLLENVLRLQKEDLKKYIDVGTNYVFPSKQPQSEPPSVALSDAPPVQIPEEKQTHDVSDAESGNYDESPCLVCSLGLPQCAVRRITGKVEAVTSPQESLYVLRMMTDDYQPLVVQVHPCWNHYCSRLKTWLEVNDYVPVTILHVEKNGETLQLGENSLFIIEPDWLINVTDMTKVDFCRRQLLLDRYVSSPTNQNMIRGNLVHLLFPHIWNSKRGSELAERRQELLQEHVADFISSQSSPEDIRDKCDHAVEHISQWVDERKRSTRLRTETFVLAPSLGMKGKIDFLWEDESKGRLVGVGELKTGRSQGAKPKPGDALQLMSYTMMLFMRGEITFDDVCGLLLYSGNDLLGNKGANLHRRLFPQLDSIKRVVNVRNDLVLMELTGKAEFESNINKCRGCKRLNIHCARIALLADEKDTRPVDTTQWLSIDHKIPSDNEKAFFQHYASLISCELRALKEIHACLWRKTPDQREAEGITFRAQNSVLKDQLKRGYQYELKGTNTTDLRSGDAVIISDAKGPSHGRISMGTVLDTAKDSLLISSDEEIRFKPVWVDPYTSESLTTRHFKGLYRWMEGPAHLKKVILENKSPTFSRLPITDKALVKILDKERLNDYQAKALQSTLCAESYCIVHGPPGSGKTKLIRSIIQAHLLLKQRVLICTGTNRALDEAMKALASGEIKNQSLRLGNPGSVTYKNLQSITLNRIIQDNDTLESKISSGIHALKNRSVVGITASSLQSGRFENVLGEFDLVVIDEAAQLTVPATVGCISFAKRFVLIGDHRQLPAVVQGDALDFEKHANQSIPWFSLSKSLFEILYERAEGNAGREATLLKDQYRMNDHICSIPGKIWYGGSLRPGTKKISTDRLSIDIQQFEGLTKKILTPGESVKFVNVSLDGRGGPRANLKEAQIVCQIIREMISAGFPFEKENALGIICPRRAQVELIRRQMESMLAEINLTDCEKGAIIVDSVSTVDRFQGSQRDVIIVSLGMTDSILSQHLTDERRLNVAMSRARHKLILLGNHNALSDDAVFKTLFDTMERELPYSDWYVNAEDF